MAIKIPSKLYEAGFFASYFTDTLHIRGPYITMEYLCHYGDEASVEEAKRKIRATIDRLEVAYNTLCLPYSTTKTEQRQEAHESCPTKN